MGQVDLRLDRFRCDQVEDAPELVVINLRRRLHPLDVHDGVQRSWIAAICGPQRYLLQVVKRGHRVFRKLHRQRRDAGLACMQRYVP